MTVTVISISHLSSPPLIPNVKYIVWISWNSNGVNLVSDGNNNEKLKRLRFENGDIILNVKSLYQIK
jgi:hypothetical protein